jgi:F-type H+-transporting ATPase subunit b
MTIDWWTLALQTVNVLILIWILARFFFRPVMDIVAKRQQEANDLLSDAARNRSEAAALRAEADNARADVAAERDKLIAAAHAEAQREKQDLLAQTSQEIAKLRAEAKTEMSRDRAAAESQILDRARDLSIDIARRLLTRFPQPFVLDAFIDGACRKVSALPAETRGSFAATSALDRHPIEVVTAAPLSPEEAQSVRATLEKAFGVSLSLSFRSDPAVIAGIELHGQNAIIRNSWRADLDRIRAELSS